jgi:hypothetical protein
MRRYFLQVFCGFVVAAVLALGPPIAFLMMPAAGFFLLLLPIWSISVVCLLFLGLLIFGQIPFALGVAVFAIAVALSPLGTLSMGTIGLVDQYFELKDHIERGLKEKCAIELAPLKKASAKYGLIVLDHIDTRGEQNYDVADTVAVLTGMRVVQISRAGLDSHFSEAWETMAEHSNSCAGERDSAKVERSPRGSQRSIAPLAVDVCLRRTKIREPFRDQTPAIVLRGKGIGALECLAVEVVERTESGDVELGRVHYDSHHKRFYPELAPPQGVPQANWQLVLLSEVLQKDLSDNALMGHAVETKK